MIEDGKVHSFNLVEQPWIPVAGVGEVSLKDIFTHPEYRRLGGNAVEKVVILRLLLCIAHACCELRDEADWHALPPAKLAENAFAYLEKWKSRFDLFDEEHPFLQFPQLKGKCKVSTLGTLSFPVAESRPPLTQWSFSRPFFNSEKALLLLASSCYGLGGGKYDLFAQIDPNGPPKRKKPTGKASAPQGPLTGYSGFLHTYMLGETLWETIHLNMVTEADILQLNKFSVSAPMGRPFWELMPTDESGESAKRYSSGYQGMLFPLDKMFCLEGENILMTQGITYPTHKNGQWDPGITLFGDPKDTKALWCDVEKKPWRQLPSLLKFFDVNENSSMPAFVVLGSSKLNSSSTPPKFFGIWTGGISVSSNSGEQFISGKNDYINSEFLIPMEWTKELTFLKFKEFMEIVDQYSRNLYSAVMNYYKTLKDERCGQIAAAATRLFWEMMEPLAQSIIELSTETDPEKIEAEKKKWRNIGMACYERFCPHISPRQIQAYVQNRPYFVDKKEKSSSKKGGKNE